MKSVKKKTIDDSHTFLFLLFAGLCMLGVPYFALREYIGGSLAVMAWIMSLPVVMYWGNVLEEKHELG
mgnify:FL=1